MEITELSVWTPSSREKGEDGFSWLSPEEFQVKLEFYLRPIFYFMYLIQIILCKLDLSEKIISYDSELLLFVV